MKINIKESELIKIIDQVLNEQSEGQAPRGLGGGATSTSSSGSFDSAGSWKQGGILTGKARKGKDGRKRVETNTNIPDSFQGGWQTVDTGIKTDGMGKISSAVNTIDQPTDDKQTQPTDINAEGPALVWPYPQDRNGRDPYDDDNPRRRKDPSKGKNQKEWRSPPCCESCGGGKWRRCQGGGKKSGPCKYNSLTDCQMLGEPKGNLKPLKLKNIYENKKPAAGRKVFRLTEGNLKKLINKVIVEDYHKDTGGGEDASRGRKRVVSGTEKKTSDPTAIFVSLIERLAEYVEKFRKTPNYTLGSEGIGKDSEFKSYVNKIRKVITKVK